MPPVVELTAEVVELDDEEDVAVDDVDEDVAVEFVVAVLVLCAPVVDVDVAVLTVLTLVSWPVVL